MFTIRMPDAPKGYDRTECFRKPVGDEYCLVALNGMFMWVRADCTHIRINPEVCGPIATRKLKQIDMSRMKGQYCVYAHGIFIRHDTDDACTPIYGHTYAHTGGVRPVPEGFDYRVTLADGCIFNRAQIGEHSVVINWEYVRCGPRSVVHFEIFDALEGYKL